MIKSRLFGEKQFKSKIELFENIKEYKPFLMKSLKSDVVRTFEKGIYLSNNSPISLVSKMEEGYYYQVVNTTNYLDSHDSVHFDGIWKKSLFEQKNKIYYLFGHNDKDVENIIATPENVDAFVYKTSWSSLGLNYDGFTEALIFKVHKDKLFNPKFSEFFKENISVEGSVRMIYMKFNFGINSDSLEFKEEKDYYDSRIGLIANKLKVNDLGYFIGVEEAKLVLEGSMVLSGSNDATGIFSNDLKNNEPLKDTLITNEPDLSTQKKSNNLLFNPNLI